MWSYWDRETFIRQPDLLVIGSGIVGLSAAIFYKEQNPAHDILVVEAGPLPSGASTKNAGFACFGSPSELLMDLEHIPAEEVFSLLQKRYEGIQLLRNWIGDDVLQYEAPGSYELFTDKALQEECLEKIEFLNSECEKRIGLRPYVNDDLAIRKFGFQNFHGAIGIIGEGQIHTGKMMKALIQKAEHHGIRIINGLAISDLEKTEKGILANTHQGQILASNCLVATNGFTRRLLPELQGVPARAQVLITEPIPDLQIKGTFHFDRGYYYFRNVDDRLLFGGGRNLDFETETTDELELNQKIQDHLEDLLKSNILPGTKYKTDQRWSGIMGVGETKEPIVRQLDEHLYCAVRLGGMGVAIGTLVGKEAAAMIH